MNKKELNLSELLDQYSFYELAEKHGLEFDFNSDGFLNVRDKMLWGWCNYKIKKEELEKAED